MSKPALHPSNEDTVEVVEDGSMQFRGQWFAAGSSRSRLTVAFWDRDGQLWLRPQNLNDGEARQVRASVQSYPDRMPGVVNQMVLADGMGTFEFIDPLPKSLALPGQSGALTWVPWLERKRFYWLVPLVLLAGLSFFFYRQLLAIGAEAVVALIPTELEQDIGRQLYDLHLTSRGGFFVLREIDGHEAHAQLSAAVKEFAEAAELSFTPQLKIVRAPGVGPNAFAYPGGPVVVTEELIDLVESLDPVEGVLAHEVAHIAHRHSLENVVQVIGLLAASQFIFGGSDIEVLADLGLAGVPVLLSANSRAKESEADDLGAQLLEQTGRSAQDLQQMFRAFLRDCREQGEGGCDGFDLFASHPALQQRIKRLEEG